MSDLISRQAAIEKINAGFLTEDNCYVECVAECNSMLDFAISEIKELPSAQPERKKGKWIDGSDERFVKCSKCGMETTRNELQGIALFGKEEPNYCPNCGADMRGEDDGKQPDMA